MNDSLIFSVPMLVALLALAVALAYTLWDRYFRLFPLSYFGTENVQRIAKWESPAWREKIFSRGMTRREWVRVNVRQRNAIDAELRRREEMKTRSDAQP